MAEKKQAQSNVRPPVVVVMGHVDHGKTKILDWYRKSQMVEAESGGITQHIGAYEVEHEGKKITFIDTPGHEVFSKLRARGAKVADIAILVVAADEGVKPQTQEAITIIKENDLPFVVALNKIDKEGANAERVKQELAKEEILVESFGGKVPSVEISAKTGTGMNDLLEVILLMAELEHLKAKPDKRAEGIVIEAHRNARTGIAATLLIRDGSLSRGNILVIRHTVEVFKTFENFLGKPIDAAGPSAPVRISGLGEVPVAGDPFRAFETRADAETYADTLPKDSAETTAAASGSTSDGEKPVFNIILKTDVAGSREALEESLAKIKSDLIELRILKSEVGDIGESDLKIAQATSRVTIVGFKVKVDAAAKKIADDGHIRIITGEVIYELIDAVKKELQERIPPEVVRTVLGRAKILKVFKKDGAKQIIGGRIEEGIGKRGVFADIRRGDETVGKGTVVSLQKNKVPAEEVGQGSEFGMLFDAKTPIAEGDVLEIFEGKITRKSL